MRKYLLLTLIAPFLGLFASAWSQVIWEENFDQGYTHGQQIGGTYTQTGQVWKSNNLTTNPSQLIPRSGTFNAWLSGTGAGWLFRPVTLTEGVVYDFEMYARQGTTQSVDMEVKYGTVASEAGMMTTIVPSTTMYNGDYQLLNGSLTQYQIPLYHHIPCLVQQVHPYILNFFGLLGALLPADTCSHLEPIFPQPIY